MPWWFWLVVAFVVAAGYVAATSSRLDRLHARVDAARAALDAQLVRRSAVTLEIAACGLLDPASSVLLASAAHEARAAEGEAREIAESALTGALRATFGDPDAGGILLADAAGRELLGELEAATTKVPLGRRFYNDAVRATLAVRRHRVVRWLRLAGRVPPPAFFEMDDAPPPDLPSAHDPGAQDPGAQDPGAHGSGSVAGAPEEGAG